MVPLPSPLIVNVFDYHIIAWPSILFIFDSFCDRGPNLVRGGWPDGQPPPARRQPGDRVRVTAR